MDREKLETLTALRFHALKLMLAEAEYQATKEFINDNKDYLSEEFLLESVEHLEVLRAHFENLKNMMPAGAYLI